MVVHTAHEAGAVHAARKAVAAPHVRDFSHVGQGIIDDVLTGDVGIGAYAA